MACCLMPRHCKPTQGPSNANAVAFCCELWTQPVCTTPQQVHKQRLYFSQRYPSKADKIVNILGVDEATVLRSKALRTLGVSQEEHEVRRVEWAGQCVQAAVFVYWQLTLAPHPLWWGKQLDTARLFSGLPTTNAAPGETASLLVCFVCELRVHCVPVLRSYPATLARRVCVRHQQPSLTLATPHACGQTLRATLHQRVALY